MLYFLTHYIYFALLISTIIAGDTVAFLGGFLAYQGYVYFTLVVIVVAMGSFISDLLFYLLGYYFGRDLLNSWPYLEEKSQLISQLIINHKIKIVLGYRFLYGFRIASLLVIGASRVSLGIFVFYNIIGSILWALVASSLGYLFGNALSFLISDLIQYESKVIIIWSSFFLLGWFVVLIKIIKVKRSNQSSDIL